MGPPPPSAVPVTSAGKCPVRTAHTPCAGDWGTGPPGLGVQRIAPFRMGLVDGTARPPVWVPASSVALRRSTHVLPSTYHIPGYPVATRHYSYHNQLGVFYPSHSNAPSTTTTIRGAKSTTRSGGQYAASRGGAIRIVPGVRRFGGTMRFFFGPDYYYEGLAERPIAGSYADYRWNAIRTQWNHDNPPMRNGLTKPQSLGQTLTYGSTWIEHEQLETTGGERLRYQYWGFSTIVPWTTGQVSVRQSLGPGSQSTEIVASGYDTRTLTSGGEITGMLSLVQPFLYHNYPAAGGPGTQTHLAFMRRLTLTFMPEPGAIVLLSTGTLGLIFLSRAQKSRAGPDS